MSMGGVPEVGPLWFYAHIGVEVTGMECELSHVDATVRQIESGDEHRHGGWAAEVEITVGSVVS